MLPVDLVAKLNECAAHDLSAPRDFWFNWLAHFTTMVVWGLVLELPELAYELKLIARNRIPYFRYRILTPSEDRLEAAKIIAFMGWILIVAGVAGERYAEVRVKDQDAAIQECSDAKVRAATLEAGDAKTSATKAETASSNAKADAHAANVLAGKAQGKADNAGASATLADSEARNAQQYATGIRTELLSFKLEASAIMSGHLFRRGDFKFALSLGPARVDITAVDGAKFETVSFAETLGQIFEDSKWHVDHQRMTDGRGIVIHNKWVDSPAIAGPAAPRGASYEIDPDMPAFDLIAKSGGKLSMREAMRLSTLSSGLDAKLQKDPEGDFQGDTIRIIIGDP